MLRKLAVAGALFGLLLIPGVVPAQTPTCPTTQAEPSLTGGGSVFGKAAAQWKQFFASKVDANNGVLCNPTIIGGSGAGPISSITGNNGVSATTVARDATVGLAPVPAGDVLANVGATTAVPTPTPLQNLIGPTIASRSITDFGAVCNGSIDDGPAFTAAVAWMSAANNRLVTIPALTCATARQIVLGDGRQRSTSLSAPLVGGETTITVASITGIVSGDDITVQQTANCGQSPCVYRGTVNGTPAGNSVTITPAMTAAAASGKLVYTGKKSTYFGGGFVGYGACSDKLLGDAVSTIKYTGAAAAATTLSGTASAGNLTITVASNSGINLGSALGVTLNSGAVHWTHVTRTPTSTTINIANEVPSTGTIGNAVKIATPVVKIAGPTVGPRLEGICIDGNNTAAMGLEALAVVYGKAKDLGGVGVINYTGVGVFLHSNEALISGYGGSSNSDYTVNAFNPSNTRTIALWVQGNAENNMAFSRNHFHGGALVGGGGDVTAAGLREEFADNNVFYKPYTSFNGANQAGAGLYRQPSVNYVGFPVENLFLGSAFIGGITDGAATGGSIGNDLFWMYGIGDSEPVPTSLTALGVTTGGRLFNMNQLDIVSSASTPATINFKDPFGSYLWGIGRGAPSVSGLALEAAGDIALYTSAATIGGGTLRMHITPTGQIGFGGITQAASNNGYLQVPAGGTGTAGIAGYNAANNATMYWNIRRGAASGAGLALESGNDIGFYVAASAVATSSLVLNIDANKHVRVSGTAPALTSCGGGSPAIVGSDIAGTVTMGTTATGCVITFNVAYAAAPLCNVTWRATPLALQSYAVVAASITLTQTSTSGNIVDYHCYAQSGG